MAGRVQAELVGAHPGPGAGLAVEARAVVAAVAGLAEERNMAHAGGLIGEPALQTTQLLL